VTQSALSTTAGIIALAVVRLTSAGTGGNVRPVSAFDTGDAPTSSAMTAPTVFGTEGAELWRGYCQTIQTVYTGGPDNSTVLFDLDFDRFRTKGIRIPAGTANGMAFKTLSTSSGTGVNVWVLLSEASF
jgi:hypothetical protein